MFKKITALVLICALVSCSKETTHLNNSDIVSANQQTGSLDLAGVPSEVKDIIANGGVGHLGCEILHSNKKGDLTLTGDLGTYEYPYTSDLGFIILESSSLPCRPNIPYFIFGVAKRKVGFGNQNRNQYSATFYLVENPSYFDDIKVVDIDWSLNGQAETLLPFQSFRVNNLEAGESTSLACRVFATDDDATVYSQEMTFDFDVKLIDRNSPEIEFRSGYVYACASTGIFPIVAP